MKNKFNEDSYLKETSTKIKSIFSEDEKNCVQLEDNIFYSHHGFDVGGMTKAICYEVSSHIGLGELGGLCPRRGGSTIANDR